MVVRPTRRRSPELHLLDFQAVTAGYSKTPLVRKLGIKPGFRIHLRNAPGGFAETLGALPERVEVRRALRGDFDFVHYFCDSRKELERSFPRLKRALLRNGALWISWPQEGGRQGDGPVGRRSTKDRSSEWTRRHQGLRCRRHLVGTEVRLPQERSLIAEVSGAGVHWS